MPTTTNSGLFSWRRMPPLALLVLLALGACQSFSSSNERRALGILVFGDGEPVGVIDPLPETGEVGVPMDLVIHTLAATNCTSPLETSVQVEGSVATIRPFDVTRIDAGRTCTDELRVLNHPVSLEFGSAGEATIRVEGRRVTSGGLEEPVMVEETIAIE